MQITKLELRNFRSFETLDLYLDPLTVLVGPNDTGKSAVLEALAWLLDPSAVIDWRSATRRVRTQSPFEVASVVAHVADFTEDELRALGPVASGGVVKIGISSETKSDAGYLFDSEQVPALAEALNSNLFEQYSEGRSPLEFLIEFAEAKAVDGRFWFDWGIWEVVDGVDWNDWMLGPRGLFQTICLGGPRDTAWHPQTVLAPLIRQKLHRAVEARGVDEGGSVTPNWLDKTVSDILGEISQAHSQELVGSTDFRSVLWRANVDIAEAVISHLGGAVSRTTDHIEQFWHGEPVDRLGPGANRALAIAALRLYRDPDLWRVSPPRKFDTPDPPRLAVMLVEEPETGLYPRAQRELARLLRDLPISGLQGVVVTHAAPFVNAVPVVSLRVARRRSDGEKHSATEITAPVDLEEIRQSLGLEPSDVLLARRFVIVEGESDRLILNAWAQRMGADFRAAGVQLVASGGFGMSEQVARFLGIAYEGAEFLVLLDNGKDTDKAAREITKRFAGKVLAETLSRTEIEGFFRQQAVTAWLWQAGVREDDLDRQVTDELTKSNSRVQALRNLSSRLLGRPYEKVRDGLAIAELTPEYDVDPEIKALIMRLIV